MPLGEPDVPWEPNDEDETRSEPDPGTVAFLDQETESFNDDAELFEKTFGFKHHCTCAQDYSSGDVVEVTRCFAQLTEDAMTACRRLKNHLDLALALLQEAAQEDNEDEV
jgi:hypothetical protein